ncbi:hypothetical protein [Streptomyces sp. NPDC093149]|uniref:hypothetical protein n=1 Tax=Streptomyces sp. NPDC093149 TaxID=3366031 RepID=UPI0037F8F1C0
MTYLDEPFPSLPPQQEALFAAAAATTPGRPGVLDAAVRLLGDILRGRRYRYCRTWARAPGRYRVVSCSPSLL